MREIETETLKGIQKTKRGLKLIFSNYGKDDVSVVIPSDKIYRLISRLEEIYKI